jgi:LytTr DNA-binding domain-containing protein
MATRAQPVTLRRIFSEPLRGRMLLGSGLVVWLAGAGYCHGYQRLLTGADEWAGSLIWSAIAIVPWFVLFEWSKLPRGSRATERPLGLASLVILIAALSILVEYAWKLSMGEAGGGVGLLLLRRLPPVVTTVVLITLTRQSMRRARPAVEHDSLESLAALAEFIAAADNYVELHLPNSVEIRRITLTEAADALKRSGFVRIHRRYLVNRGYVAAVHLNGERVVRLKSGKDLRIGSSYTAAAAALLPRRS